MPRSEDAPIEPKNQEQSMNYPIRRPVEPGSIRHSSRLLLVSMLALAALVTMVGVLMAAGEPATPAPILGSPFSEQGLAGVRDGCPTFSWGRVDGAQAYELAVYRLPQRGVRLAGSQEDESPRLHVRLDGSLTSWTSARMACPSSATSQIPVSPWRISSIGTASNEKPTTSGDALVCFDQHSRSCYV